LKAKLQVNVMYCCGCGFRTLFVDTAKEHANKEKHTLTATGCIRPLSKCVPKGDYDKESY
jgi:hypothetical protein